MFITDFKCEKCGRGYNANYTHICSYKSVSSTRNCDVSELIADNRYGYRLISGNSLLYNEDRSDKIIVYREDPPIRKRKGR